MIQIFASFINHMYSISNFTYTRNTLYENSNTSELILSIFDHALLFHYGNTPTIAYGNM